MLSWWGDETWCHCYNENDVDRCKTTSREIPTTHVIANHTENGFERVRLGREWENLYSDLPMDGNFITLSGIKEPLELECICCSVSLVCKLSIC